MKKKKADPKTVPGKIWFFIWEDDSMLSWFVNVILAFILIKFIVYPGLGYALSTTHPIVAVKSNSMNHQGSFDDWWDRQERLYDNFNITKRDFESYSLNGGFSKGDLIILKGSDAEDLKIGDVIVFVGPGPDPIIHRIIRRGLENNDFRYQTKGDANLRSFKSDKPDELDETNIRPNQVVGKAFFKIPWVGYVKILAVESYEAITGGN